MRIADFFIPSKTNNYKSLLLKIESVFVVTVMILVLDLIISIFPGQSIHAEVDLNSLVYLHNKERIAYNVGTLDLNSLLITSATNKAAKMLEYDCWDHYCPPGVSPWTFFTSAGYSYIFAGENLGEGFTSNDSLMRAWMNSPTHKENVIKPEYKEFGIGFAQGFYQNKADNTIVVVHFGSKQAVQEELIENEPKVEVLNSSTVTQTALPTPTITQVITPKPTAIKTPAHVKRVTTTPMPTQNNLVKLTPIPTIIQTPEPTPSATIEIYNEADNQDLTPPITNSEEITAYYDNPVVNKNINNKGEVSVPQSDSNFIYLPDFSLKFDFSLLSLKATVNLLVIILFTALLMVDYVVIQKYYLHLPMKRDSHHSHLTLGLLLVVAMITFLVTGLGQIL